MLFIEHVRDFTRAATKGFLQFLLLSDGAVSVDALASKEAMTHHALAKQ
jgi:hypothetical protein